VGSDTRGRAIAVLEFDGEPQVVDSVCDHCGEPFSRVTGFLLRDGDAYVIFFASCYHHDGHEVWIDVVFSSDWGGDDIRTTFGCRVGQIEGQEEPAATMVEAAAAWDDAAMFGRRLNREEGLAHPLRDEFWAVVDHVLVNDPTVAVHMGYT
jgi:hypothetical protein